MTRTMTIKGRIKKLLKERFHGNVEAFVDFTEISKVELKDFLNGKSDFSELQYTRIATEAKVRLEWLLSGQGTMEVEDADNRDAVQIAPSAEGKEGVVAGSTPFKQKSRRATSRTLDSFIRKSLASSDSLFVGELSMEGIRLTADERNLFSCIDFLDVRNSVRINPIQNCYGDTWEDAVEMSHSIIDAYLSSGSNFHPEVYFYQRMIEFLAASIFYFQHYDVRPYGVNWQELTVKNGQLDAAGKQMEFDRYYNKEGVETPVWRWKGRYADLPHVLSFILLSEWEKSLDVLMTDVRVSRYLTAFKAAWKSNSMDEIEAMVGTLRIIVARFVTPESFWILSGDEVSLSVDDAPGPFRLMLTWNSFRNENRSMILLTESYSSLIVNRYDSVNGQIAAKHGVSVFLDGNPGAYNALQSPEKLVRSNFAVCIKKADGIRTGKENSLSVQAYTAPLSNEMLKHKTEEVLNEFLMEHFRSIRAEVEGLGSIWVARAK